MWCRIVRHLGHQIRPPIDPFEKEYENGISTLKLCDTIFTILCSEPMSTKPSFVARLIVNIYYKSSLKLLKLNNGCIINSLRSELLIVSVVFLFCWTQRGLTHANISTVVFVLDVDDEARFLEICGSR